jgi:hypothetical protein
MKNRPNPFTASNLIIEERLKHIESVLKAIDNATKDNPFDVYQEIKYSIRAIDKQHAKTISVVLAALVEYEPGVVHAFADYQQTHQMLGLKMLDAAETLVISTTPLEKATAAAALIHRFNKYSAAIHENTSREEVTLLPLLKRYYNGEEIMIMQVQAEQALVTQHLNMLVPEPIF